MRAIVYNLLQRVVKVKDREVPSLVSGFGALFCSLGSYFLLLPLRDEAGLTLGTALLPTLFNCSFLLTIFATPLTSAFLSRPGVSRSKAARQLFSLFALSILAFFLLYQAVSQQQLDTHHLHGQQHRRLQQGHPKGANASPHAGTSATNQARLGDASLTTAQKAVRIAFYLWLGLLNLLATSTLWARAADAFDSNAASRLFGFLGAGATIGQLMGSLVAAAWASLHSSSSNGQPPEGRRGPPLGPLLVSAVLLEVAGRLAANMQSSETLEQLRTQQKKSGDRSESLPGQNKQGPFHDGPAHPQQQGSPSKRRSSAINWDMSALKRGLSQSVEGVRLIAKSGYLCHVCLHFVLHYIVSTFFYFEKTLVVASSGGSASQRVATFATLNSMSAGAVALIQLTATGRMLSILGTAWSLAAAPLVSVVLMAAIAVFPNIVVIGIGEILRKVINYSLARPAREILYTVLSVDEKYKAKVCIDTIILRMGDSMGAAVFRILDRLLGFGPAGLASTAVPLCIAWSTVAFQLGRKQQRMSTQHSLHR